MKTPLHEHNDALVVPDDATPTHPFSAAEHAEVLMILSDRSELHCFCQISKFSSAGTRTCRQTELSSPINHTGASNPASPARSAAHPSCSMVVDHPPKPDPEQGSTPSVRTQRAILQMVRMSE